MIESKVIHEITPLMGKDVLYIAERRKKEFTYPIHNHKVFELNFVEHAPGVRRIVGDSNEVIGEYDPARTIHHRFTDLFSLLFVDGNPAGVKAMLSEMGFIENVLRLPLVPMRINNMQRMSEILKELKI